MRNDGCARLALSALDVDCPWGAITVVEAIIKCEDAGYKHSIKKGMHGSPLTLALGTPAYQKGRFLILTEGHLMALVDGELTDTANTPNATPILVMIELVKA